MRFFKKYLSFFILFLFVLLNSSCTPTEEAEPPSDPTIIVNKDCDLDKVCVSRCQQAFSTNSTLLKNCLREEPETVDLITSSTTAMEKRQWSSIKAQELKALVDFDKDTWVKYSNVSNKTSAREMLLWIAKTEEIAESLDNDGQVLKNAFSVLGASNYYEDQRALQGMKQNIDLKERQGFFEVSAFNENKKAFQNAHKVLKEECGASNKNCLKEFYCGIYHSLVFGMLNELGLGADTGSDGSRLHADECPRPN